ncbi:3-deoxy-8-phosphooctulonate synthase, partial [Neisseria sp. P0015.S004]
VRKSSNWASGNALAQLEDFLTRVKAIDETVKSFAPMDIR